MAANGADVKQVEPVTFTAVIEVPPHTGKVVAAEWDFEGDGSFPVKETFSANADVSLKTAYKFSKPGTYFVTLRVASQRQGDGKTVFARIQNLERVRVVVK